jgi:hypothetical protein
MKVSQKILLLNNSQEFNPDDIERYADVLNDRKKIIDWLKNNSSSLGRWSMLLTHIILEEINRKQSLNISFTEEKDMMNIVPGFFTKISYLNALLSDWSDDTAELKESLEKMIEQE